ncbi:MAG: GNAT family N-acetyltransferase [bacterium]
MPDNTYVRLRPLTKRDLDQMAGWEADEELNYLLGLHLEREQTAYWSHCEALMNTPGNRLWALETVEGKFIGEVELGQITWRTKEAELKICIGDPRYRGQGYGTAAVEAVLDKAFYELKLERVYLRVYNYNIRAVRCYLRNGFKKEAVLRNRRRFQGKNYDVYLMYIDRQTHDSKERGKVAGK